MKALLLASVLCATTVAAEGPTAYIWQLTCVDASRFTWGPWTAPDACQAMHASIGLTCERPTVKAPRFDAKAGAWREIDVPNPDFVRIADVCQVAHNGRDCVCEYLAVEATPVPAAAPRCTLGALFRANVTRCEDLPIQVGP